MRRAALILVLPLAVLAVTCSRQPTAPAGTAAVISSTEAQGDGQGATPMSATIEFGRGTVGSPFPPGSGHDQSGHARDSLFPRTVVIRTGGTVTFTLPPDIHQISIYDSGTDPDDIDTSQVTTLSAYAGCAGNPVVFAPLVITDSTNRIANYPIPCFAPATRTHTFTEPGKYLVICAFLPHFRVGMYGWVIVKD